MVPSERGVPTERDRDGDGRARNARPRDALGRLLPVGSIGVQRAPEGVVRTPDESLALAQALLDSGQPFHAHEVLEDAWKSAPPDERELWRGLAQLAVGLTHQARGNRRGAAALLRRGAATIEPAVASDRHGVDVAGLITWARSVADRVEAGTGVDEVGPIRLRSRRSTPSRTPDAAPQP